MAMGLPRLVATAFTLTLVSIFLPLPFSLAGEITSIESVPDLQRLMYVAVDGYPCVRLLNLSGEIGCSNPGLSKVVAPIIKLKDVKDLVQPHTVLVTPDEMEDFFTRVSNDLSFASKIGGVLIESGSSFQQKLKGLSPDNMFPQAEFSPYGNVEYKWNPTASSIMWKAYNFPVYLLSESGMSAVHEFLSKKERKHKTYTSDVAEFSMVMETTKAGTHNSEACLQEGTCLPLGGYSVWSSLPPINVSSSNNRKPIVLTVASMDSASFFRDKSFGADSPISGLVALLGAVDALSRVEGFSNLKKQLVFLVLTGETWGYLGSRRFLHELDLHSDAVAGLSDTLIETVLEIGSVGKGLSGGINTFFAHKTRVSSATNKTLDALKVAQDSFASKNIKILSADKTNPGIPPSSLMAFMKKNPQTSAVVLEDFDTKFANKFYHSHLDDLCKQCHSPFNSETPLCSFLILSGITIAANVNSSSVVAAASVVARTLYILASDNKDTSSSALGSIQVNASFVEELLACLLSCEPGLSCNLVKDYISPTNTCPGNYAGVMSGEPSSNPYLGSVSDVSRFLWNFLAEKTSVQKGNTTSVCSKGSCSRTDQVCIKAESNKEGTCVVSTTRYVPAYSTRLKYADGAWTILPQNTSDSMGMVDPVWTESNWNTIGLQVYTVQHSAYDNAVLVAGITVTTLAYFGIMVAKSFITKALKQD
ncbi:nicastrin isoform X1 [Brassica rapa]|uniref:nicastrin isoform X1 n=1 Tax=Brassica campestris TaxID=3711 RepID=UPI00142D779C|nr:nicastrin isoform X1 [Brassica rapa]XP_048633973.1 nicastrin isoform X1 [Brassica napus]